MKLSTFKRNGKYCIRVIASYFQPNVNPQTKFVIFGRGRSGSTALVSMLDKVQGVHCDQEILNHPVLFPSFYVDSKCRLARSEIYGFKLLSYQLKDVQPLLRRTCFLSRLYNKGFKIIYLKRENLVAHAVSNIRARNLGFHSTSETNSFKNQKVKVDPQTLLSWIHKSERLDEYEQMLLSEIPSYLSLTYEKHLEDEALQIMTMKLISSFLGFQLTSNIQPSFKKVSPKSLDDSVENMQEIRDFLRGTKYFEFVT